MAPLIAVLSGVAVLLMLPPGKIRAPGRESPRAGPGKRTVPSVALVRLLEQTAAGLRSGVGPVEQWRRVLPWCADSGVPEAGALLAAVGVRSGVQGAGVRPGPSAPSAGPRPRARARWQVGRSAAHHQQRLVQAQVAGVVAACHVAVELGAPLAPVLERSARAVEAEHQLETETAAALAGPGQTVRLISGLPVWGVAVGVVMGTSPLAVIGDGGVGTLSAVLGGWCWLLGRRWISRLVAAARAAGEPGRDV